MAIFNKYHTITIQSTEKMLAFADSNLIKAYPCGARHASYTPTGETTAHYIPYDPEARLATESTSRKTSGGLGLPQKQSALITYDKSLDFYLNGYFFELSTSTTTAEELITKITDELAAQGALGEDITKIYANIIVQQVQLYSDTADGLDYKTWILRDQEQQAAGRPLADLDQMVSEIASEKAYYFSGLSFSKEPRAGGNAISTDGKTLFYEDIAATDNTPAQQITSILLFEKDDDGWKINQAALLPKIEHGAKENSVKLGDLDLKDLNAENLYVTNQIKLNGQQVPSIQVVQQGTSDTYQLVFTYGPMSAEQ